jgi:hypothetical protein
MEGWMGGNKTTIIHIDGQNAKTNKNEVNISTVDIINIILRHEIIPLSPSIILLRATFTFILSCIQRRKFDNQLAAVSFENEK